MGLLIRDSYVVYPEHWNYVYLSLALWTTHDY